MRTRSRVSLFITLTLILTAPIAFQILSINPVYAPPITEFTVPLYVDGFDNTKTGWTRVGVSPYLSAIDYPTNYIGQTGGGAVIGSFSFQDVSSYDGGKIFIEILARVRGPSDDRVEVRLSNSTGHGAFNATLVPYNAWSWLRSADVSSVLYSVSEINAAKVSIAKISVDLPDLLEIDTMRLVPEMQRYESHPNRFASDFSPLKLDISPDGDVLSQWSGSGGGAHYKLWDDYPTHDVDGTYLYATASNLNETSTLASPPAATWTIQSVNLTIAARQTTGDEQIRMMLVIGGTGYNGSLIQPTTTYKYFSSVWTTNPATGSPWAWADITNLEAGVRSQQNGAAFAEIRVTQLFVGIWRLANPQNAYDDDDASYAAFRYSTQSGSGRALQAYNFSSPWQYPANLKSPLPLIDRVDFGMRYNVSANTAGAPDDYYSINYQVGASAKQTLVSNRFDTFTQLWVNGFDNSRTGWIRTGTQPYLGAQDYPTNYLSYTPVTVRPDGDGLYTAWSGTYQDWDDVDSDGEATIVSVTASNLNESSTLQNPPALTWPIASVKLTMVAAQTIGEPFNALEAIRMMLIIDGKAYNGSLIPPDTSWGVFTSEWLLNPDTGLAWTWPDLNDLQAGVRSQADGPWLGVVKVTQLYLEVFPGAEIGDFSFGDLASYDGGSVVLEVYARGDGDDSLQAFIYNQSSGKFITEYPVIFVPDSTWGWSASFDISSTLNSLSQINNAKVYFLWRVGGDVGSMDIDAVKLKVFKKDFMYQPTTITWASRSEPNNGTWEWDDINNIKFSVDFSGTGGDAGCQFSAFEMWVEVYTPKAKFTVLPSSIIDYTRTPSSSITLRPNGNGPIQWSVYPGATAHYDAVDDLDPHNGDTDYVYVAAHAKVETFQFEDTAVTGNISSVRVIAYARSTIATDDQFFLCVYTVAAELSDQPFSLTTSYRKYTFDFGLNPQTKTYWTWTDINNLRAGMVSNMKGGSWQGQARVTQVYVQVFYEVGRPQLTVDLAAENVIDVSAYSFILSYDTRVLTATGRFYLSPFTNPLTTQFNDEQGWAYMGGSLLPGTLMGVTGNATLARIVLMVDDYGYSALDLSTTKLTSAMTGAAITHFVTDGEFENAVRDVAVMAVTPAATVAFKGYDRSVSVEVKNEGPTITETFDVTLKFSNSTYEGIIGTDSVTLAPGASTTRKFWWVTTDLQYGYYTISAYATILPERDTADNFKTAPSSVLLTIPGDINGDKYVGSTDAGILAGAYGSSIGQPAYKILADINEDDYVGSTDAGILAGNYGKSW